MRYRVCPKCKSKATKIINASAGTSTCQSCEHVESLENYVAQVFKNKDVKNKTTTSRVI